MIRSLSDGCDPHYGRVFRHRFAAIYCDGCGQACNYAPWRGDVPSGLSVGLIWSPGAWGSLYCCDDCTEAWYKVLEAPDFAAGTTQLLTIAAIR